MEMGTTTLLIFLGLAAVFVGAALWIGLLVRPRVKEKGREATYECGEVPVGQAWYNFNPRFYIIALIFLIFDVEIILTIPVAVVFRDWVGRNLGWLALGELLVFIVILIIGLVYVWGKGDLEWVKDIE